MPQNCHICEKCPQEILILNCKHNICLQCAHFLYKKYTGKEEIINCVICGSKTPLDTETIHHINRSYEKLPSVVQKCKGIKQHSLVNTINFFDSRDATQQNVFSVCTDHCYDQLNYICFTCNMQMICPQCFINGGHQGHQVLSVKKYLPTINKKLIQKHAKIAAFCDKIRQKIKCNKHQVEQRKIKIERLKYSAIQNFRELKKSIEEQERTIVGRLDTILSKYQKQQHQQSRKKHYMTNQITETMKNIENLQKQLQSIKPNDKAKQSSLFCRYKQIAKEVQKTLQMYRNQPGIVQDKNKEVAQSEEIHIQNRQLQLLTNRIQKITGRVEIALQVKQNVGIKHCDSRKELSSIQFYDYNKRILKGQEKQNTVIIYQNEQILFNRSAISNSTSKRQQYNYLEGFQTNIS